MSITIPYNRAGRFYAPLIRPLIFALILASIMLTAGLASSGAPISYLAADYLDASSPTADKANERPTRLFDMETEPVVQGSIPDKWRRVKTDIAGEFEALRHCLDGNPCPPAARRLLDISAQGAGRSGRARVGLINRAVDMAISPASDERQWGEADRWSAPFETLQSSRGDCEDYAILKYVALLAAGVPAADVKIVIMKHLLPREDHAAVAARVDGEWLILDNLTLTLVRDTDLARSIPEFALDQDGAHRFLLSSRSHRSASAS
jgi:predicted transglutaminase-like cysteine proteinase